jgi:hypothetical protein
MTPNAHPLIGTLQKGMPTLMGTATLNRRAVSYKAMGRNTMTANAQASVLQPFPATVPSLQNTCFCARANLFY